MITSHFFTTYKYPEYFIGAKDLYMASVLREIASTKGSVLAYMGVYHLDRIADLLENNKKYSFLALKNFIGLTNDDEDPLKWIEK